MDPFSALSLAGTIVQFVDFGTRIFSDTRSLYQSASGAVETNIQLELIVNDLRAFLGKVRRRHTLGNSSSLPYQNGQHNGRFEEICAHADKLAEELISNLEGLKVQDGKHKKWQSLKAAVKCAWKQDQMENLKRQLLSLRDILNTDTILMISNTLDSTGLASSSRFDALDKQTQLLISTMANHKGKVDLLASEISHTRVQTLALVQMLSRLQSINHEEHQFTREMIANREKRAEDELTEIVSETEMLTVKDTEELKLRKLVYFNLLKSLQFPSMNNRYQDVMEAFPKTLDWAFCPPSAVPQHWSNLRTWFEKEDGVYWISGKAGSGKTTLMKHIVEDRRTRSYLTLWAKAEPLCIATFYFWLSGSQDQRSQTGMLRSLLFQILRACPDLAPVLFPVPWASIYSDLVSNDMEDLAANITWPLRGLLEAFQLFVAQTTVTLKTCLFIDGLDEFEGEHDSMATLFKNIGRSSNIKICVSSRPLVVFQQAFQLQPSLRLQELTFTDIEYFVTTNFQQNEHFQRFSRLRPESALSLIKQTVERADGVFLWVKIAVRSLLNGLINRDSAGELQKRLSELPTEIEPLYQFLLNRIETRYLVWAARTFKIMEAINMFYEANAPNGELTLMKLNFALCDQDEFDQVSLLSEEVCSERCDTTGIHVIARCAGLLEVGRYVNGQDAPVRWFHRTARDFVVKSSHAPEIMHNSSLDSNFDPNIAMSRSTIMELVFRYKIQNIPTDWVWKLITTCMRFALAADNISATYPHQTMLVDRLDTFMSTDFRDSDCWEKRLLHGHVNFEKPQLTNQINFLHVALCFDLTGYIRTKINETSRTERKQLVESLLEFWQGVKFQRGVPWRNSTRVPNLLRNIQAKVNEQRIPQMNKKRNSRQLQRQSILRGLKGRKGFTSSSIGII